MAMKVIGIDPGLAATGIGIVSGNDLAVDGYAFGTIDTAVDATLPTRLDAIYTRLSALLEKEKPDFLVIEDVFSLKRYPKSGISLGQVSGVILLAAFRQGIVSREVPVREAKQVLTGNGNASKWQLEKAVRCRLQCKQPIRPFHASDALGLALIGLYRHSRGLANGKTALSM
jgi:crossover junction endodeoxyribonuclease RuvC